MTDNKPTAGDFESSLKKLEELVRQLETGELPLEKSLACYEEGMQLVEVCRNMLTDAEQRIAILTENRHGIPEVGAAEVVDGEIQPTDR